MTGKTLIIGSPSNIDIYTTYGIYVTEGGYNGLMSFPSLKKINTIDWAEEDGEEADLSNPVLDIKEVTISFAAKSASHVGLFFEKLCNGAYHIIQFNEISKSFMFRLASNQNIQLYANGSVFLFSLTFSDDFPLDSTYDYVAPSSTISINQPEYSLDGILLSQYGVVILQGSNVDILKSPDVKLNQFRSFNGLPGLRDEYSSSTYDPESVFMKSKDVTLKCLMRAADLTEFWNNYNALLFDLIRVGKRTFVGAGITADCHYQNSTVSKFYPSGKIWMEFTLTLKFLNYRITATVIP